MNIQIELIIGGRAQGKRETACREHPDHVLLDGGQISLPWTAADICSMGEPTRTIILDHTHLLVRRMMAQWQDPGQPAGQLQGSHRKTYELPYQDPGQSTGKTQNLRPEFPRDSRETLSQEKLQATIFRQLLSLTCAGTAETSGTAAENERTVVYISDEIGSGIVPMDPFERSWREVTGRVLTALAARADRVERVTCGIVQVLK